MSEAVTLPFNNKSALWKPHFMQEYLYKNITIDVFFSTSP